MWRERLAVIVLTFLTVIAGLIGGQWAAQAIDGTDKPDTFLVVIMTILWGIGSFCVLSIITGMLGMIDENEESNVR